MSGIILGYGFIGDRPALIEAGCDPNYIYLDKPDETEQRDEVVERAARDGDEVRVLFMKRLGAWPQAQQVVVRALALRGVTVTEHRPPKKLKKRGPKPSRKGTPEQWAEARKIWLTCGRSEASRLRDIKAYADLDLTRSLCNGRFGWPSKPKPEPETDE